MSATLRAKSRSHPPITSLSAPHLAFHVSPRSKVSATEEVLREHCLPPPPRPRPKATPASVDVQMLLQRQCSQQQQQQQQQLASLQQLLAAQPSSSSAGQPQLPHDQATTQFNRAATPLESADLDAADLANKRQKATPRWSPTQTQLQV
jgi:hypothetical protein